MKKLCQLVKNLKSNCKNLEKPKSNSLCFNSKKIENYSKNYLKRKMKENFKENMRNEHLKNFNLSFKLLE